MPTHAASISEVLYRRTDTKKQRPSQTIPRILHAIRTYLKMDVAFISEFEQGRRYFRYIDSGHPNPPIKVNGSDPLEESYCQRVVHGHLPGIIHDAALLPAALKLPVTTTLPVGAHLSVPIVLSDGDIYGTFCCFSYTPDASLSERDLGLMQVFSEIVAEQIDHDHEQKKTLKIITERIESVLAHDAVRMVYQPIYQLDDHKIVGFEALSRFTEEPVRTPDIWFEEAAKVGLDIPLEIKTIELSLQLFEKLPANTYLSVNISPKTILESELHRVFSGWPVDRILLEVTEHAVIEHYDSIAERIMKLRSQGLRIAVDDAGAGYSSFKHILKLAPDIIKIDLSITRDIDTVFSHQALASAFLSFADATQCTIIAEGVETQSELETLRKLGVHKAQGYLLGRPAAIDETITLLHSSI
jgi:EAL domain-containing protein (putative c-di-GMP-specific phosphodiesterase class I)